MAPEESEVSALSGSNSGTDPASHSTNRSKARQTLGRTRPIVYSDGQIIYSMGTFQAEQDEDEYGPRMPAAHPGRSVSQGVSEVRAAPDEVEELAAAQPVDKMRRLEEGGRAEDDEDVRAEQRAEGGADGNSQPEGDSATGEVAGEGALGASAAGDEAEPETTAPSAAAAALPRRLEPLSPPKLAPLAGHSGAVARAVAAGASTGT